MLHHATVQPCFNFPFFANPVSASHARRSGGISWGASVDIAQTDATRAAGLSLFTLVGCDGHGKRVVGTCQLSRCELQMDLPGVQLAAHTAGLCVYFEGLPCPPFCNRMRIVSLIEILIKFQ